MGCISSKCSTEAAWKPFVTTQVRNVVVNTLLLEPTLYMVKDCNCKICAKVNKREPSHEEAMKYNAILEDAKRSLQSADESLANKRKSVAIR